MPEGGPTRHVSLDDMGVNFSELVQVVDRIVIVKGIAESGRVRWWWNVGDLTGPEALGALDLVHKWLMRQLMEELD